MAELLGLRPEPRWGAPNAPNPPVPSAPDGAHTPEATSKNATAVEIFPGAPYGIP